MSSLLSENTGIIYISMLLRFVIIIKIHNYIKISSKLNLPIHLSPWYQFIPSPPHLQLDFHQWVPPEHHP